MPVARKGAKSKRLIGGSRAGSTRSDLLFVPPLAQGMAAPIFTESDEEDAVKFCLEALRNNHKGSPPAGDSVIGSHCQNLVSKLNVLLDLGDLCPISEYGLLAPHGVC